MIALITSIMFLLKHLFFKEFYYLMPTLARIATHPPSVICQAQHICHAISHQIRGGFLLNEPLKKKKRT